MRSRTFVSAALSCLGLCLSLSSIGHAADPKAKKKGSSGELSDVNKTLQWEESVMGEDNKRGELDKILKAQAINKAATEKAEREKAKAEAAAAKEAAKEAASPKAKKNSEVSIGDLPDEGPSKGSAKAKSTEISPKLETTAAAAPPPPAKPADDKFIDKLLKEDGSSGKKKRASSTDDRALQDLIAGEEKPKAGAAKGKKKSEVDSLLENADKQPEVVTTKVRHETPEWAKPEIQSTPTPAPVVVRPAPRRDDGVIRVVQGAAGGTARPVGPPPAEPVAVSRPSAAVNHKQQPTTRGRASSGGWDDPFATESTAPKKSTAGRVVTRPSNDDDFAAPAPRKANTSKSDSWDDPFSDGGRSGGKRGGAVASAPARPVKAEPARAAGWKDPFLDDSRSAGKTARKTSVARETAPSKDDSKWATAHGDGGDAPQAHSRWGILKKR
jgi:colicin import membrane protein